MELDKSYFDAAVKRFNQHIAQGSLFEPEQVNKVEQLQII
jgi:hypothetical protein